MADDLGMVDVEPAGQGAERRKDDLGRRNDEAAAGHAPALEMEPQLGMEMARHLGPRVVAYSLGAQHEAADLGLLHQRTAAVIGKARIVVADDPRPVEAAGEVAQQRPRVCRQTVAAEAVVKAVAEAIE